MTADEKPVWHIDLAGGLAKVSAREGATPNEHIAEETGQAVAMSGAEGATALETLRQTDRDGLDTLESDAALACIHRRA